ncbi:MAG: gliding motility-associated C-terminal domain-containing protein, partial [Bacteroidales bacterium]|nr:gliding motility-associated C-terminal domain-containing protein [Bacteroidales bacterium]
LDYALQATPSAGTCTWTKTLGPGTASFTPDAGTPNALVTVDAYGSYEFTWTEVNGTCSDDSTITVNFDEQPAANAGPGGDECDLDYTLQATPSAGTGTWTKTLGPGTASFTPDAGTPNALVTVDVYGSYEFTWTEVNGTCSDDSTITVNFYEQPAANAGPGGDECDLDYALQATPSAGTGTWTKTLGPGTASFTPDAGTPNALVTVDAYGSYEFIWTEVNGTCSADSTIIVHFYEPPIADAGQDISLCSGEESKLNASGGVTYSWSPETGLSNSNIANPIVNPTTTTLYTLTITDLNGCSGQDTVKVTVNPLPEAEAGEDITIYYGSDTVLNASGGIFYSWDPATGLSDPGISNPIASPIATTTYFVTVTDSKGCQNTDSIKITVLPGDFANAGSDDSICPGESVNLNASGGISYSWSPTDGLNDPSISNPIASPTITTTYTVAVTDINGVQDTDEVTITVNPLPVINAGENLNICEGESVQLQASGEGIFKWDHSNILSNSNIPNPVASPNVTITFTVTLTDQNGCENFDELTVVVHKQPTANAGPDQELDYVFETTMEAELNSSESGEWSVVSGSGEFSDKNSPVCMVTGLSLGDNIFTWKVTNGVCPEAADEVKITVNDLLVPSVITPNGDNKNDYFVVRGIGNFDSSELIVFNRWGAEVYKTENYENDWDGRDHNGNELPDDTYFFILNIKNVRVIKGYVVIKR